jgi:hypothetical protein
VCFQSILCCIPCSVCSEPVPGLYVWLVLHGWERWPLAPFVCIINRLLVQLWSGLQDSWHSDVWSLFVLCLFQHLLPGPDKRHSRVSTRLYNLH